MFLVFWLANVERFDRANGPRGYARFVRSLRMRKIEGVEVWHVDVKTSVRDYMTQLLPGPDKAAPPKGTCGAFCKGQATKTVVHRVAEGLQARRVY